MIEYKPYEQIDGVWKLNEGIFVASNGTVAEMYDCIISIPTNPVRICQYTGFKDKEGEKLYRLDDFEDHEGKIWRVVQCKRTGAWGAVNLNKPRLYGVCWLWNMGHLSLSATRIGSSLLNPLRGE